MTRSAQIFVNDVLAGVLSETPEGEYSFKYNAEYLANETNKPVSLTLPKREEAYVANNLFAFFVSDSTSQLKLIL